MKRIELFADGSGGFCDLEVLSGPFSGVMQFYFDFPALPEFIANLEALERELIGKARLGQQFEEPYIEFHGDGLGHVTVSGLLGEYSEHMQQLKFSFATDQTALAFFIAGLKGKSPS